jgi:serine protease inhibitor
MTSFTVEAKMSLEENMCELDMSTAFDEDSSFEHMSDNTDVYLKSMEHVVKIKVDKSRTQSVAVVPIVFTTRFKRPKPSTWTSTTDSCL